MIAANDRVEESEGIEAGRGKVYGGERRGSGEVERVEKEREREVLNEGEVEFRRFHKKTNSICLSPSFSKP